MGTLQAEDGLDTVKATIRLGSETNVISSNANIDIVLLSKQLVAVKQESMCFLKDYITRNNAPADVPDELEEGSSDGDEDGTPQKPKSKKRK